ncbi:MAG: GNAT family N-acetyltransferase [Nitrososphaerota archaeon]|nr:GNAT family N-acetyltransferase [Nitrososphaerota archaeon]
MQVTIREWKFGDASDLAVVVNNKKLQDNLRDGLPFPYVEKDAEAYIGSILSAQKGVQYIFAILCDGKVIGSIGVHRRENVHRLTAEIGYCIAEPYWGKGITTEAVRLVCDYVFTNTDIVRVFAEFYVSNTASCRVLEKAGFQYEGTLRQNAIKNGQIIDMKLYALLKTNGTYPA